MSLNGLDDPAVIDAYQTALAEAGGWLLLNYASRDEVALLGRGTGGVPDVRATVEGYEDKSPLYGFLQYRRRKIILKYLPDGMSRLLQARTTVQFQSILDKFSPHDTTFEFKASGDLTESALSSACLLHAVSGSITSSSSSLRRRRLMEIAEDAEEGPPDDLAPVAPPSSSPDDSDDKRLSQMSDATAVPPKKEQKKEDSSSIASTTTTTNVVDNDADARTETASVHSVSRKRFLDQFHRDSFDRRSSTQSARPTLQELNYAAPYRQKVKLEHRPSVDINNRPRTAGSMSRGQDHRPVAALPAGVRSRKPAGNPNRPKSTHDVPPPMPTLASLRNAPPVPLLIPPPTLSIAKPRMSPGAKSMNAIPSSGMSPEKQRLMKALELRKKQMEKKTADLQKKQEQTSNDTTRKPTVMESLEADKENIGHSPVKKTSSEATVTGPEALAVATIDVNDEKPLSADIAKADSAVEMVTMASKDIEEIIDGAAHEEENSGRGTDDANHSLETPLEDNFKDDAMDSTNTELAREETLAQRTADEDTTTRLPEEAELEEQQKPMQANEESSPHELEVPTITVEDDNEQMEPEFTVAGPADEEIQRIPIAVAIEPEAAAAAAEEEVRAEDVPLPPEAEEDLGLPEAPTALVPTQPMQPMQPLPHPQPQPQRLEKHKRITLLEPIQVPTPDFSDDENLLSDDSLMDELTSATVQEAKPVPVGKGPLSPDAEAWQQTRSVSNPNRGRPSDFSSLPVDTRSISATFADGSNQAIRPMVAKKVNVSSGISKRIKALEMFSNNRDSAPNPTTTAAAVTGNVASPTASAFEKFRKRASISLNGNLPSTTPSARSSFISTSDSFPVNRSDSRSISKLNSVSVTARIVRDPSTPPSELKANPVDTTVLGFQRSSLIVRHDSSETQTSDQMSSSHSAFSPKSSRRNSTDTAVVPPRSDSRASSRSRFDERGRRDTGASPDDKKDSRTSRLMRRMSSLRSSSRMNLISPPGVDKQQLPPPPAEETVRRHPPSRAIDIGEVNVQFPDTLLWKRRYLRVDDQGYLVLTPGNMDTGARNVVKRYHLSEFKTPCLPDEERQELPNSILLDFRDGSTLQCACESRKGQAAALQTLVDAHNAYHQ